MLSVYLLTASLLLADGEPQALVLIADGAGDFRGLSTAVQQAVTKSCLPLEVQPLAWSHGYGRSLADQADRAHMRAEGKRMASIVLAYREACPERPIYLMGHSAGAGVVLEAAHWLPPDCVERIALMAPTVSAFADIRPALICARHGMDVYYSHRDRFAWVSGFTLFCSDGRVCPRVAARIGFRAPGMCLEDEALLSRLKQHAWDPSQKWTGHNGGHYGAYQQCFLLTYMLPLLLAED